MVEFGCVGRVAVMRCKAMMRLELKDGWMEMCCGRNFGFCGAETEFLVVKTWCICLG
jgi:hypothetical protein